MDSKFTGDASAWLPKLGDGPHPREVDKEIAEALGWRVSHDDWWNWHPGPHFDPPGDAWCIRRDARLDLPCNEALPHFTPAILMAELQATKRSMGE